MPWCMGRYMVIAFLYPVIVFASRNCLYSNELRYSILTMQALCMQCLVYARAVLFHWSVRAKSPKRTLSVPLIVYCRPVWQNVISLIWTRPVWLVRSSYYLILGNSFDLLVESIEHMLTIAALFFWKKLSMAINWKLVIWTVLQGFVKSLRWRP